MIELVQGILERDDLSFELGDELVGIGLLDLGDVLRLKGGLHVVSTFLEETVTDIETFDEGHETFELREAEDPRILGHVGGRDGGLHFHEVIELRTQFGENLAVIVVEWHLGGAAVLAGETVFERCHVTRELAFEFEGFAQFHEIDVENRDGLRSGGEKE